MGTIKDRPPISGNELTVEELRNGIRESDWLPQDWYERYLKAVKDDNSRPVQKTYIQLILNGKAKPNLKVLMTLSEIIANTKREALATLQFISK